MNNALALVSEQYKFGYTLHIEIQRNHPHSKVVKKKMEYSRMENWLILTGLLPAKALGESMKQSKVLTAMVLGGVLFFSGFFATLLYLASLQ